MPKFVQVRPTTLAAPITVAETSSILLRDFVDIYGNALTMSDFGSEIVFTFNPGGDNEEIVRATGFTVNADGSVVVDTGIVRGLSAKSPYASGGTAYQHSNGETVIVGNTPQFYDLILDYVNGLAIAGAPDASTIGKGIVEVATQAEVEAGTATGSTGAPLVVNPASLGARFFAGYAVDAGSSDSYAITLAPVPTSYFAGMIIAFKANTVNTGACSIDVNVLGTKSLKVSGKDPRTGYIPAGGIVVCIYDGTNFEIISVSPALHPISQDGGEIYAADSVGTDAYAVTLSPAPTAYATGMEVRFKAGTTNTGTATLNVNGLGAKTIKRDVTIDLSDGDIQQNQIVSVIYDGTNFQMLSLPGGATVNVQVFTSSGAGTWTKPTGASIVDVYCIGGGAGGASGQAVSGGNNADGGGAGGGGSYAYKRFRAGALSATESVSVGAGGAGGAALAAPGSINNGNAGSATTFGTTTLVRAPGGSEGSSTSGGAGGVVGNGDVTFAGGAGGAGGSAATGSQGVDTATAPSPRGGGGGGGFNVGTGSKIGGVGGAFITNYAQAGGAAATVGNNGSTDRIYGGTGGGGGQGSNGGSTAGGNGGTIGAGGAGGGGGTTTSGKGGDGATGAIVVITFK